MINSIKIGQEIWYKTSYVDVNSGIIKEIHNEKERGYVIVNGTHETYGTQGVLLENCYPTKEALLQALQIDFDNKVKTFCDSIQTINDLVKFCYDHNMNAEEYTEWEAHKAAQIRAKELLNIDLE